jgi:tetratricopeptide (TPR) repeat protein
LILLPLRWLGLVDPRWVYVLAYTGLLALIYLRSPDWLRGIALLPMMVNLEPAKAALGGVSDTVWALLLGGMLVAWRRPGWRAVLYGLACAYKQTPWLLLPFLLARIFLDPDDADTRSPLRRSLMFAGLAGLVFLAPNLPYLLVDPGAWARGVLEPATSPLIYFGSGLSLLTQLGYASLPKAFYSLAGLLVWGFLLALYVLRFERWRDAAVLFPGIILWFSYRSLQSYYIFWIPLATLTITEALRAPADGARVFAGLSPGWIERLEAGLLRGAGWVQRRGWTLPAAALVTVAALAAGLVYFWMTAAPLRVERVDIFPDWGVYAVGRMELTVYNATSRPARPRVAVQKGAWEPYPWEIESGPDELQPGERGVYLARTDLPYRMFSLSDGAQVVVTDANGDYRAWGAYKIRPEMALLDPDAINNPNYWRGSQPGDIPYGWGFDWQAAQAPKLEVRYETEGFAAASLALTPSAAAQDWEYGGLSQSVPFPLGELALWVYPAGPGETPAALDDLNYAYGLETLDAAGRRLWLIFGPQELRGYLTPNHYVIQTPAPRRQWSEQRVNLAQIYAELNWPLPAPQRSVRGMDLELDERMITLRWLIAVRRQPQAFPLAARFGPLRSLGVDDPAAQRVRAMIASPGQYWMSIADHELRYRNYEKALTLYETALSDPQVRNAPEQLGAIYQAMGWIELRLGNLASARERFGQSLQLEHDQPGAVCGLGWTELNTGQLAKAEDLFQISSKMGYPCRDRND